MFGCNSRINLELLQVGSRVKFARFAVCSCSGGLDLYLQIQNQSGALRDDTFVKYDDSTRAHDSYTAPVRYI